MSQSASALSPVPRATPWPCLRTCGVTAATATRSTAPWAARDSRSEIRISPALPHPAPRLASQWAERRWRLSGRSRNKAKEWLEGTGDRALADWDISARPARYSASASRNIKEKVTSTSGSTRRSATWRPCKKLCAKKGLDFEKLLQDPKTSRSISSQGHHLLPHRSGRRC